MRDVTFGQYYPTESVIHRLDPRAKMIFTILYIVGIFFIVSFTAYVATFIFLFSVCLISKVPLKTLLKSVKGMLFILIFTSLINLLFYDEGTVLWSWWKLKITSGGITFSIKMFLRLSLLIMGTSLLTFTTKPMELSDGIESLLKPLKYLKVPVHDIALIMSIALRLIPNLLEETDKITMAQKARGADFDSGGLIKKVKAMIPVLIPLFVGAFRKADELADALDSRCYKASTKRTKLKQLKFSYLDAIGAIVILAVVTLILLDKYLVGGIGVDKYVVDLFNLMFKR